MIWTRPLLSLELLPFFKNLELFEISYFLLGRERWLGLRRKEKKVQRNPELEMKADEFLYEKRDLDGEERFWSDKSEVRLLLILPVEEGVASSQD